MGATILVRNPRVSARHPCRGFLGPKPTLVAGNELKNRPSVVLLVISCKLLKFPALLFAIPTAPTNHLPDWPGITAGVAPSASRALAAPCLIEWNPPRGMPSFTNSEFIRLRINRHNLHK